MSAIDRHTGIKRRNLLLPPQPVFDYLALMEALKAYRHPRDKVTSLLRDGVIIRVKKGLYITNTEQGPGSTTAGYPVKEVLSNLLYGPSYISLQYALHLYGMIPEHAVHVTSVTFKKSKRYQTPVGRFVYRSVPRGYYVPGVVRRSTSHTESYLQASYLAASPEKALMDTLYFATGLRSFRDVQDYVLEDLRIDPDTVRQLSLGVISDIARASGTKKLALCSQALERL